MRNRRLKTLAAALLFLPLSLSAEESASSAVTRAAYEKTRIGQSLEEVTVTLGREGRPIEQTFYGWTEANLRVAFGPDGLVAKYGTMKPGPANEQRQAFIDAFRERTIEKGERLDLAAVQKILGSDGEKLALVEVKWRNPGGGEVVCLFEDGKLLERGVNGRLP